MKLLIVLGLTLATLAVGQIRHDKGTILDNGHKLLIAGDKAMAELIQWHKSYDTKVLKQEQAKLRLLLAQLEATTEPSAISRIAKETEDFEVTIAWEIQKINTILYGNPDF